MATVLDIIDSVKARMREDDRIEVTFAQMISFINDAAQDLVASGWVIQDLDEAGLFVAGTYEYVVPSGIAFIHEIRIENTVTSPSTWDEIIPLHFWRIGEYDSPMINFHKAFPIPDAKLMRVLGQKRPSLYTATADTIDSGMEPYIRESALASALSFQSAAIPELEQSRSRFALAGEARLRAEQFLSRSPQRFRQFPNARYVPGR